MFQHILTSTDGSDAALKGVTVAIEMAAALKARLTILHASAPYHPDFIHASGMVGLRQMEEVNDAADSHGKILLDQMLDLAAAQGVIATLVFVKNAHAATAILDEATALGCDIIVIGSHGRRGLSKLFLGSQAAEVLAGTQLPVMIVNGAVPTLAS